MRLAARVAYKAMQFYGFQMSLIPDCQKRFPTCSYLTSYLHPPGMVSFCMFPTGMKHLLFGAEGCPSWSDEIDLDIPGVAFLGNMLDDIHEKMVPNLQIKPDVIRVLVPKLKEEFKEDLEH